MLALVGLLGIVLFIVLLARNKTIMPAAFVIVILLIPLCLGIPLNEISGYITDGIASTATLGIMAAFAILFFTLMNKLGVFDTIVGGSIIIPMDISVLATIMSMTINGT